ncbi:LORF2 protein, partial [Crocuta crocuta]
RRCTPPRVIREAQSKTMRTSPPPLTVTESITDDNRCWRGCGATGPLLHCWWEAKLGQPRCRTLLQFLIKLNTLQVPGQLRQLSILTLDFGSDHDLTLSCLHGRVHGSIFTTVRTWKPPECPWVDEWVKRTCSAYLTKYFPAFQKRKEPLPFVMTWVSVKDIALSEQSWWQKDKH